MKKYDVEVTAIFEEIYEVEAESEEKAQKKAVDIFKEHLTIGWIGPEYDADIQVTGIEEQ